MQQEFSLCRARRYLAFRTTWSCVCADRSWVSSVSACGSTIGSKRWEVSRSFLCMTVVMGGGGSIFRWCRRGLLWKTGFLVNFLCKVDAVWCSSLMCGVQFSSSGYCEDCPSPLVCSWLLSPKLTDRIRMGLILGSLLSSSGPLSLFLLQFHILDTVVVRCLQQVLLSEDHFGYMGSFVVPQILR